MRVVIPEHLLARILKRPAVRADDDVALRVSLPLVADEVAVGLAGVGRHVHVPIIPDHDARHTAVERQDLVVVLRPVHDHVPAEVGTLDRRHRRRQFDTAVADFA